MSKKCLLVEWELLDSEIISKLLNQISKTMAQPHKTQKILYLTMITIRNLNLFDLLSIMQISI